MFDGAFGSGSIRFIVSGTVTIDGLLTVDGVSVNSDVGEESNLGGGAAGSIWIDCTTLAGSATGMISAVGGTAGPTTPPYIGTVLRL